MKKYFTLAAIMFAATQVASAQFVTKALDDNDEPTFDWSKTEKFIPIAVSESVEEAMAGDIVFDAKIDDTRNFLWIWDNTYVGVDQDGSLNSFGAPENHMAMDVSTIGWSGCGFCAVNEAQDWTVLDDSWVLHFAMKSTDNASHRFAVGGKAAFTIGQTEFEGGKVLGNFERDGEWYYIDVPYSVLRQLTADGEVFNVDDSDPAAFIGNYLTVLSGGIAGTQLRLDNIFWYKDNTIEVNPGVKGDLNGDGVVDVEDMNTVINMMLGKADKNDNADLNGDGTVDVEDMNTIINIMLGKN